MLRDAVVHFHNEQPLLADLLFEPAQTDTVVICRNLRTMNGKKPDFVDRLDSTFILPFTHVRFVEIPRAAIDALTAEMAARTKAGESDDDLAGKRLDGLARLGDGKTAGPEKADPGPGDSTEAADPDALDSDLLRRIRDA